MIKVYYYYFDSFSWKIHFRYFDTYEDFGYWYSKHYTKIRIDKIKEVI